MQSIIDQLCDEPIGNYGGKVHGQDSIFVKTARVKCENLDKLMAGLSDAQKELFEAYSQADSEIEGMMYSTKSRYSFQLGALIMMEVMQGKEEMFK